MNSDVHTRSPTPAALRQWHHAQRKSRLRYPSSSSVSSTDPSLPSTPQDAVFLPLPVIAKPVASALSSQNSGHGRRDSPTFSNKHFLEDSSRYSAQSLQGEDFNELTHISRSRTQTVTPATLLHTQSDIMRIPFPTSAQRDSASSVDSQFYNEELGEIAGRHPLHNRFNSNISRLQDTDQDIRSAPSTKFQRARAYTHRPESTHSVASTKTAISRTSTSLRLKSKKAHAQRGAISLFKSLASSSPPIPALGFENIEFDWAKQRRGELDRRARQLERDYDQKRQVIQSLAQNSDGETKAALPSRPRSWELTPQGLALKRELDEEESRRFIFRDCILVNSSYLSAHPKDVVPYPVAYDKVNLQTDRHSHDLVRQIFSGRPSIHDNVSHKNPVAVLDLGCGDGSWIIDSAQCWRQTLFYGLDIQKLHPSHPQLVLELGEQLAENIRFTYFNFIADKFPYLNEKFDMVRMANLKWAIPEDKWDFVLGEVHRILKRGGWVEIIDDDFLLPSSVDNALSPAQLVTVENIETQFKNMLKTHNLLLNTSTEFMTNKLGCHFTACHEEGFAVAISKARSMAMLPMDMSHKTANSVGMWSDDRHLSSGPMKSRSRPRSGSISSTASCSTQDDASAGSETLVDRVSDNPPDGAKQGVFQPIGLDIHPGRFIPLPPHVLSAHAIKNMQSILACKEAIRANELKKSPELVELEAKEEILLEERQSFEQLSFEWDEQQREFDDAFWEFESTMLKRICLPHRYFEVEDDEEGIKTGLRSRAHRAGSRRGSDISISSTAPGTLYPAPISSVSSTANVSSLTPGTPVRFLRVYRGWK